MTDAVRETTGDRVRRAMADAGVRQTEAAVALAISQGQLSRRIRGVIAFRVDELVALAALCNVPVASLIAESEVAA